MRASLRIYEAKTALQLKCANKSHVTGSIQDSCLKVKRTEHTSPMPYAKAFCDTIIQKRIIQNLEVLRMTKLHHIFIKSVKNMRDWMLQSLDRLKRRLQVDYPQLKFHSSSQRNVSDIVFMESTALLEQYSSSSDTGSGSEAKSSEESDHPAHEVPAAAVGADIK
ncbi:hypothetical protein GJAV_G00077090 [Gymnothorax javanicus]|nr:hypothetical protein GJAV_G00077090 [Gymnothorax javanicus]